VVTLETPGVHLPNVLSQQINRTSIKANAQNNVCIAAVLAQVNRWYWFMKRPNKGTTRCPSNWAYFSEEAADSVHPVVGPPLLPVELHTAPLLETPSNHNALWLEPCITQPFLCRESCIISSRCKLWAYCNTSFQSFQSHRWCLCEWLFESSTDSPGPGLYASACHISTHSLKRTHCRDYHMQPRYVSSLYYVMHNTQLTWA
jgi:hypothetical protein